MLKHHNGAYAHDIPGRKSPSKTTIKKHSRQTLRYMHLNKAKNSVRHYKKSNFAVRV